MIFGIGTDIAECSRFKTWCNDYFKCKRFFNEQEIPEILKSESFNSENLSESEINGLQEHLASRFAAKEAFVKAMGTGFANFDLKDIFITKDSSDKPIMNVCNKAKKYLDEIAGDCKIHVSLSHEKAFSIALVVIEKL